MMKAHSSAVVSGETRTRTTNSYNAREPAHIPTPRACTPNTQDSRTQFTAKYSAILLHVAPYQYAAMRDMNEIASSIVMLIPIVQQCIDLCRMPPAERHRDLSTMKTLLAGIERCVGFKQRIMAAFWVYKQTHLGMVGEVDVDHKYLDDSLKTVGTQGGKIVVREFPGWDRGLPATGGGRGTGYSAQRSQPGPVGMFVVGGVGRFPTGGGHYTPPRRGGGYQQRGRGRGMGRGPGAGSPGRKPICARCDSRGTEADHSHSKCPFVVCHKCHQAGHIQVNCPI